MIWTSSTTLYMHLVCEILHRSVFLEIECFSVLQFLSPHFLHITPPGWYCWLISFFEMKKPNYRSVLWKKNNVRYDITSGRLFFVLNFRYRRILLVLFSVNFVKLSIIIENDSIILFTFTKILPFIFSSSPGWRYFAIFSYLLTMYHWVSQ